MKAVVPAEFDGKTAGSFLRALGASGTLIKRVKTRPHGLTVSGGDAETRDLTVRDIVRAGETVFFDDSDTFEDENEYVFPADIPLDFIYEDDDVFVVNKPAGMPTHTSHGHYIDTLANALCHEYKKRGVPFVFRAVNRLDADTSGAVLLAKSRLSAYRLSKDMAAGRIKKVYLAVLDGEINVPCGKAADIRSYITRRADTIILRESHPLDEYSGTDAEFAETVYACICKSNGHSLIAASPVTGRTHQLRVHFSSLGYPIEGDELYGGSRERIGRQALHAFCIGFPLSDASKLTVTAPVPDDIGRLISRFGTSTEEILDFIERAF